MYKIFFCVDRLEVGEVRVMCIDFLLVCFICFVVVNLEQYGIIFDVFINEVVRFNLMQVCFGIIINVVFNLKVVDWVVGLGIENRIVVFFF